MPYSDIAREYLLREGIAPDRVIKTGSPMFEVLSACKTKINSSKVLSNLGLEKNKYFLVSSHREENVSNIINFKKLINSLNQIADVYGMPIIVSTHPRTRRIIEINNLNTNPLIKFIKPLGFIDYNSLQIDSFVVLSDSGTISEESSILNFRALNIREAHERPEAMEEGSVIMVGLDFERILQGINLVSKQKIGDERTFNLVNDYHVSNVSDKVLRIILSYVSFVKRVVWSEN
jgi:UDP-N-acetylglucosamine 2-epimerase (non-hydrolysing)